MSKLDVVVEDITRIQASHPVSLFGGAKEQIVEQKKVADGTAGFWAGII